MEWYQHLLILPCIPHEINELKVIIFLSTFTTVEEPLVIDRMTQYI